MLCDPLENRCLLSPRVGDEFGLMIITQFLSVVKKLGIYLTDIYIMEMADFIVFLIIILRPSVKYSNRPKCDCICTRVMNDIKCFYVKTQVRL